MATSRGDSFITPDLLQNIVYEDSKGNKQTINLYIVLANEWSMVCDLIGFSIPDKKFIAKKFPADPKMCIQEVMETWISNKDKYTKYPCTWNGICKLLNHIKVSTISKQLEEALKATKSSFMEPDSKTHDASGDGNKPEGDKSQPKGQSGENLIAFIKSKIKSPEKVTKCTAVINMAGLPEAGKTTLIDSLLGRQRDNKYSTDICEPTIVVDYDDLKSSSTAVANWKQIDYKRSFGSDIHAKKSAEEIEGQSSPESPSDMVENGADGSAIPDTKLAQHDSYSDQPEVDDDTILGIINDCEIESFEELKTKSSLYIRDVGGQLEFKESLSLLVFGPSIYIFVFNPCFDIDLKQKIVYRKKPTHEDEKEVCEMVLYESMISTKTALLQCLSSVQALQNTIGCDGQVVKSRVLIVGTHKDIWSVAASPSQFEKVSRIKNDLNDLSTKASEEADNLLNDLKSKLIEKYHLVESKADEEVEPIRNELKKICKESDVERVMEEIQISDIKKKLHDLNQDTYKKAVDILKNIEDILGSKACEKAKVFVLRLFLPYDAETTKQGLQHIFCSNERKINKKLKNIIEANSFDHIVTSYKSDTPMFAVDNFDTKDDGVKKLRERITNILEENDIFKFEYSTAEILFSLDLVLSLKSVLTLDDCKNLAKKKWKIRDVENLLRFFHSQVGVIQWFDSKDLRNWVFKDPNLLYSMISEVIVATFINDSTETDNIAKQAKLGIFQKNVLEKIFTRRIESRNQTSELDWKTIIDVFIHLRLIAPIKNTIDNKTDTTEYFLPCVLQPISDLEYKEESGVVSTLCYSFKCGNCPIGLFGALVATLMRCSTTIAGYKCEVYLNRKRQEEQLCKDQVVLNICINDYKDEILLRSHAFFMEVKYISQRSGSEVHSKKLCCTLARMLIDEGIDSSLKLLHYDISKVMRQYSFMCSHCKEIHIPEEEVIHCDGKEYWKQVEEYWFNKDKGSAAGEAVGAPRTEADSGSDEAKGEKKKWQITYCSYEELGEGCHGTMVYKGEFDKRSVAVKRLPSQLFNIADKEVELLRDCDHANVVRYYFMEQDANFKYIALELAQATLHDYVSNKTKFTDCEVNSVDLLEQAMKGLAHLHSIGIVHRDIKPHNVLLFFPSSGSVTAKISDFGLSKKLPHGKFSFTKSNLNGGTEGWAAPEVLNESKRLTFAVDIFSMGCVIYYVLTSGSHPFGSKFQRTANIENYKYDLSKLSGIDEYTASDLLKDMISHDSNSRPTAEEVLCHCLFWSEKKQLEFFQDVSDFIQKNDQLCQSLEVDSFTVFGNDWMNSICDKLKEDLSKWKKRWPYEGSSIKDLLRVIRNKKHHYGELPEELKQSLGCIPDEYVRYFTIRFPKLLIHTHKNMKTCKEEHIFKPYYSADFRQ